MTAEIVDRPRRANQPPPTGSRGSARPYYQGELYAALMDERGVPFGARILFEELVRCSGRRGYTWQRQAFLADRLGRTVRTIQRWERSLVDAGLLTVARISMWARWRQGGVRRVAVPHTVGEGGSLGPPAHVLARGGRLDLEGLTVRVAALRGRRTIAPRMSPKQAPAPSMEQTRKRWTPLDLETCRAMLNKTAEGARKWALDRLRVLGVSPDQLDSILGPPGPIPGVILRSQPRW